MPIKGLTDRGLSFPEIGKIRKGSPKTEKGIGQDLQYFRVEFDGTDTEARDAFLKAYPGGQPASLRVVLPFNDIESVWEAWLEAYTAGRLVARSDGEIIIYQVDTTTGETIVRNGMGKDGRAVPYRERMEVGKDYKGRPVYCKAVGRMKVVLPDLMRMAYLTLTTGSKHDIINLSSQLQAIQALCLQMGKRGIGGVPLVLTRRPVMISCPEIVDNKPTGKRVRRNKWLISIEADPEFVKRALLVTKSLALPGNGLALPDPRTIQEPNVTLMEAEEFDEDEDLPEFDDPGEQPPEPEPGCAPSKIPEPQPHTAEQVKEELNKRITFLTAMTVKGQGYDIDDKKRSLLASVLGNTLRSDTDRYTVCRWLVGESSTKKMSIVQVQALLDWQGVRSFEQMPAPWIIQETIACLEAANKAAGQKELI